MKSSNVYSLPIKKRCSRPKGSPAHIGKLRYSIDFSVPESTPVYASLGGTIVFAKNDSMIGGPHKRYWSQGNRIVIRHKNGEYSAYEHLQYRSSKVRLGQKIRRGQKIGLSGTTGYSYGPHLHFEVFNKPISDESEGITVIPKFVR